MRSFVKATEDKDYDSACVWMRMPPGSLKGVISAFRKTKHEGMN